MATGTYDDPEFAALASPVSDGLRLKDLLSRKDVGGYEVTVCSDPDLRTARLAIEDFFAEGHPNDLNFVLISGHGLKDQSSNLYFAVRDTRRSRAAASALDALYVSAQMRRSGTRQQILCVDTCFSGAFPQDLVPKSGMLNVTAEDLGADTGTGSAIITASDSITVAMERETAGRTQSVFTRHLIEGIESGTADLLGDGRIMLDELFRHVSTAVRAEIPSQSPKIFNSFDRPVVVALNPNFKKAELPPVLMRQVASRRRDQRALAVEKLYQLASAGTKISPLAVETLERLTRDDSNVVANLARESLSALASPGAAVVHPPVGQEPAINPDNEVTAATSIMPADDLASSDVDAIADPGPATTDSDNVGALTLFENSAAPRKSRPKPIGWLAALAVIAVLAFGIIRYMLPSSPVRSERAKSAETVQKPAPMVPPGRPAGAADSFLTASAMQGRWVLPSRASDCKAGGPLVVSIAATPDRRIIVNRAAAETVSFADKTRTWIEAGDFWLMIQGKNLQVSLKGDRTTAMEYAKCP